MEFNQKILNMHTSILAHKHTHTHTKIKYKCIVMLRSKISGGRHKCMWHYAKYIKCEYVCMFTNIHSCSLGGPKKESWMDVPKAHFQRFFGFVHISRKENMKY